MNKQSPLSKISPRNQPPRDVLVHAAPIAGNTKNKTSFATSPANHDPTFLKALKDDSFSLLPDIHYTSQRAGTKSGIHHGRHSLTRRLMHFYISSPHASIQSLVAYHNKFPNEQSSRSYNMLLHLAIRHSAFGTAHALLQSMRASRVPENQTTWKLCVRLLVREGRWSDAYDLVFNPPRTPSRAPFISDSVAIAVWVELLGTAKRRAFRDLRMRDPGMCTVSRYSHVMDQLPKLGVSSMGTPPSQVIYASVAALLRIHEREAARQVTCHFLQMDPKGLGLPLVHLHLALGPRRHTTTAFYRAIRNLHGFLKLCPELEPNSTTLFLLLGHLKRVKRCGIIGHNLVRWFRRRWGDSVVSPRVERRLLALAVKERRVDLIKEQMNRVEPRRNIWRTWSLEREVVDGVAPKQRSLTRQSGLRLAKAGTEWLVEDWVLRRASKVLKARREAID